MVDVLILTASFGNGHNAATQGIIDQIYSLFPDMNVVSRDLFSITTPRLKGTLEDTYRLLTRNGVPIYNAIYNLRNHKDNLLDDFMLKIYYSKFELAISELNPRMLISVFPTCAQFAAKYKLEHNWVKTITVLTDVVDSWEWIHPLTDIYCVPAEHVKEQLIEKGLPSERVFVTGIPVKKDFNIKHSSTEGPESIPFKNSMGNFSINQKRVLMLGSAMGKLSMKPKTIETLGHMPYHFTIVTGQDESLYERLKAKELPANFTLVGFTDQVHQLMKQSDLIVTKPGGATIFEAIESNLPILIQPSNVGQETSNKEFVERYGFGDSYLDSEEMIRKIDGLLADDVYSDAIKRNMRSFKAQSEWSTVFSKLGRW